MHFKGRLIGYNLYLMTCVTLWTKFHCDQSNTAKVSYCQSFLLSICTTQKTRKNAQLSFFRVKNSSKKMMPKPGSTMIYFIFNITLQVIT